MVKKFRLPGDELESAVLETLWDIGIVSVRELHERVGKPQNLVYTPTAKLVDLLRTKGLILRVRTGTAFLNRARAMCEEVERARVQLAVTGLIRTDNELLPVLPGNSGLLSRPANSA